ncbi:unnamed protein product [Boreogadus saida]
MGQGNVKAILFALIPPHGMDSPMWSEKESVGSSTSNQLDRCGANTAQALNDEEERAMAIIDFSASQGIPGGVDILAGITEEGDPSSEQWQEDEEPRIPH